MIYPAYSMIFVGLWDDLWDARQLDYPVTTYLKKVNYLFL